MAYLTLYDAVTAANIPSSARYAAGYVDGRYANIPAIRKRCPHAEVLSITVFGANADCCDCENGDLTPGQAESWVAAQLAHGAYRPCVYASASTWASGLQAALAQYGPRIRRWVAAYPGSGANVPAGFDAHQYSDGGGNLDTSVTVTDFFDAQPAPAPDPPHGVANVAVSFDLAAGSWSHHGLPGIVHWGPHPGWASVELQLAMGGPSRGEWRLKALPLNAPPLGG